LPITKKTLDDKGSRALTAFPGGNRVAIAGVDDYGKLWTNIDKTSG